VATHFEDAATFFPMLGGWEVWQLINLSGDTHPIHIHLDPFHVLGRRPITVTVPDNGIGDHETTATRSGPSTTGSARSMLGSRRADTTGATTCGSARTWAARSASNDTARRVGASG
jgi:FtsP/CotA-like multicopper oxidase with cupredoxin domain